MKAKKPTYNNIKYTLREVSSSTIGKERRKKIGKAENPYVYEKKIYH